MTLRFGTDGVRGIANRELTPELLVALGRAAATVLGADRPFVVGRDTRRSGPMVEAAIVAGLASAGADVALVGVLPTPGLAYLAAVEDSPAVVVSASHNPATDNGVKLFARGGRKLADEHETMVEKRLAEMPGDLPDGAEVGRIRQLVGGAGRYVLHLADALDGRRVGGLHVVVDTANGAAYDVAPSAIREVGARVDVINAAPDGLNINAQCGSTSPDGLRKEVVERGADLGLALDGDADRVLAVDETGALVDGDQLLAILAIDRLARGALPGSAIVATVMSNLGLRHALAGAGIGLVETPVGDRHVLAALDEDHLVLGGEQSGHIVVTDLATTGDGTLVGLLLLDVLARSARPLSDLASVVQRVPQVLRNVEVSDPAGVAADDRFLEAVGAAQSELGSAGRVVVRPSGTEPLLRVMVEGPAIDRAEDLAARLAGAAVAADTP